MRALSPAAFILLSALSLPWGFWQALSAQSTSPPPQPLALDYYTLGGCHDCQEVLDTLVEPALSHLEDQGIQVVLKIHDIVNPDEYGAMVHRLKTLGLSFQGAPMVLTGGRIYTVLDMEAGALERLAASPVPVPSPLAADQTSLGSPERVSTAESAQEILESPAFQVLPVFLAGLVDGINPCAISTLLFLVSVLLAGSGRQAGNRAWVIGSGFVLGVFLAYTGIGLGLLKTASALGLPAWVAQAVRWVGAGFLLVLGLWSVRDWFKARQGAVEEIGLRLPPGLKELGHRIVRSRRGRHTGFLAALGLGCVLSLLEFVCTGQVYLPTLVWLFQVAPSSSLGLLLIYNLAFILPLVLVFLALMLGSRQETLVRLARQHLATSKLLLAGVFLLMAILMVLL